MIKLQGKQKQKKIKGFIYDLKMNPKIIPFLNHSWFYNLGYIDFHYIKGQRKNLQEVEKNIKQNKYQYLKDLTKDLKDVFLSIADYLFCDDVLQQQIKSILKIIDQFETHVVNQFKLPEIQTITKQKKQIKKQKLKEKQKQKQKVEVIPIEHRKSTFAQKLQMIYFLKAHQDNQHLIRQIGKHYNIGKQVDDQYIIKLDNVSSSNWLEIIQRKQN